jgi:hypothetical protein
MYFFKFAWKFAWTVADYLFLSNSQSSYLVKGMRKLTVPLLFCLNSNI